MSVILPSILPYLESDRTDVRLQGLKVICSELTALLLESSDEDIISTINSINNCLETPKTRELALTLLVNITAEKALILSTNLDTLNSLFTSCSNLLNQSKHINLVLIIISNLTVVESNVEPFLNFSKSSSESNMFQTIVHNFISHNPQSEDELVDAAFVWDEIDKWQHGGSVLCNITRFEKGQQLILCKSSLYYPALCSQIRSKNLVRRRSAIAAIRNCLFDTSEHWWIVVEANIITLLLFPIVTNAELSENEKKGMDPVLWLQVVSSYLYNALPHLLPTSMHNNSSLLFRPKIQISVMILIERY